MIYFNELLSNLFFRRTFYDACSDKFIQSGANRIKFWKKFQSSLALQKLIRVYQVWLVRCIWYGKIKLYL